MNGQDKLLSSRFIIIASAKTVLEQYVSKSGLNNLGLTRENIL